MKTHLSFVIRIIFTLLVSIGAFASPHPPKNVIAPQKAERIALHAFSGKIKSSELEFEHGQWIYSFDIAGAEKGLIHEVQVDAVSGKVVSHKTETAKEEAAEAEAEAGKKAK